MSPTGEFVALLGPSGCGKTTLLRLIAGFETLSDGAISFGPDLFSGPAGTCRRKERNIAIVFQSYALWPHMSVARECRLSAEGAGRVARRPRPARWPRRWEASTSAGYADAPAGGTLRRPAPARRAGPLPRHGAADRASRRAARQSRRALCAPRWRRPSAASTSAPARPWSTSPTTRPRRWRSPTAWR